MQARATENLIRLMESTLECCLSSCRAISRMAIPNENKPICVENRSLLHHLIHFCSSQNKHLLRFTATGIFNLSSNDKAQEGLVESNGVKALLLLTRNNSDDVVQAATKALCNLGIRKKNQDRIVQEGGIMALYILLQHDNVECVALAVFALSNLCSERQYNKAVAASGSLYFLSAFMKEAIVSAKQIATVEIVYNLSTTEDCHVALVKSSTIESIKILCKSEDVHCRRYSIMALGNLSANKVTRNQAIKGGGLQAAVRMLTDNDDTCKIYACVCLANMANNSITQNHFQYIQLI